MTMRIQLSTEPCSSSSDKLDTRRARRRNSASKPRKSQPLVEAAISALARIGVRTLPPPSRRPS